MTIEQLDVDKMQIRIAMATLSRLFMQSQDCGPHVCTQAIQRLEHWWWHFGWVCSCMSKDWLADCQSHYMVLGLDNNNKKRKHSFLCALVVMLILFTLWTFSYMSMCNSDLDQNGLIVTAVIILKAVTRWLSKLNIKWYTQLTVITQILQNMRGNQCADEKKIHSLIIS